MILQHPSGFGIIKKNWPGEQKKDKLKLAMKGTEEILSKRIKTTKYRMAILSRLIFY